MIPLVFLLSCTDFSKKSNLPTSVIVIGGGPSGLAIAERIDPRFGVLLLEAENALGGKQRYTEKPEFFSTGSNTQQQYNIKDEQGEVVFDEFFPSLECTTGDWYLWPHHTTSI